MYDCNSIKRESSLSFDSNDRHSNYSFLGEPKEHGALNMQRNVCGLRINSPNACVATCTYKFKVFLHEYTNLHSASEGSKYDSLAGVITDLLLGLLQLEKQVCRSDIYLYSTLVDTSKQTR